MCSYLWCVLVLVSLFSSGAITSFSRSKIYPCSQNLKHLEEFRCLNRTGCINIQHLCDGIGDCPDSSDEVFCLPPNQRTKRQDACTVPAHPSNGVYEVVGYPEAKPGQSFESMLLTVRCRLGFGVLETSQVYCVNGRWFHNLPKCVRFCKLEPHASIRFECRGNFGFIECGQYVAPGTSVRPLCNSPLYYSLETLSHMNCVSGSWDYVARCKAECGRITPEAWALVVDGKTAKRGELPWHVGIYRKTTHSYTQICGGSLVSNNVVISAAHCFWSDVDGQLPASGFAVAIGKLYSPWDNERDFDAQKSDVKEIKIPKLFQGEQANFQLDIAVLILTSPFTYKPHIRPVCLNYDRNFNRLQLQHGKLGKVAGWGMTTADGNPSHILQVADMPYISEEVCIDKLPATFREYITGDKFCAGYTNGTALCQGDSGGGLVFPDRELGIKRFYLRGIVSTAPKSDDELCNENTYTAFTKVTDHEDFIKEAILSSVKKICPHYLFQCADGTCVDQGADCNGIQECPDGSDETDELCQLATNTTEFSDQSKCILPSYPEHGTYDAFFQEVISQNANPGQAYNSWSLIVSCSRRYSLVNSNGVIEGNSTQVNCRKGNWQQSMPKCQRYCNLTKHPSVLFRCQKEGTNQLTDCGMKILSGSSVTPVCNTPNYYSPVLLSPMECIAGLWNYNAECSPECGRVTPTAMPLVINGTTAKRGELPWHVGVYTKTTNPYRQICGGTIVANDVVISAAHCFTHYDNTPLPAENFAVAAGKLYRAWNDVRDVDAQNSDVKNVDRPKIYRGHEANFQGDIAILKLATPFMYKTYVRPVCLSFDFSLERRQLQAGVLGKTAGWGLTEPNGNASPILNSVQLPYINVEDCFETVPPGFRSYITADKFCAGYTNGTAICKFDSGGGLSFTEKSQGVERYFLRGVSSTAPASEDLCNANVPTTFTLISAHERLIKLNLYSVVFINPLESKRQGRRSFLKSSFITESQKPTSKTTQNI